MMVALYGRCGAAGEFHDQGQLSVLVEPTSLQSLLLVFRVNTCEEGSFHLDACDGVIY